MPKNWEPPAWRKRKEPLLDAEVQQSVERGDAHPAAGHSPEGHRYAELVYGGCATEERAREIKSALYRAAGRLGVSLPAPKIVRNGQEWDVHYRAACKECARLWVVARYGPDRQAWPYNPREKKPR
jgi:hypothetical protein